MDNDLVSISTKWRLDGSTAFGRRTNAGSVRACSPLIYTTGDFVDVTAVLDIATLMKNGLTKSKVHLSFTRVIQLCPADKVPSVSFNPYTSTFNGPVTPPSHHFHLFLRPRGLALTITCARSRLCVLYPHPSPIFEISLLLKVSRDFKKTTTKRAMEQWPSVDDLDGFPTSCSRIFSSL